jgi:putative addiction module component (TIGR02574 family)
MSQNMPGRYAPATLVFNGRERATPEIVEREATFLGRGKMSGMEKGADSVLDAALKLPEKERARVAKELIASLDEQWDEGVEEAWAAEVERRRMAVAQGRERLVPWEQVKDEARAALKTR